MFECKTGQAKERVNARLRARIEECKVILEEAVHYEGFAWERGAIPEHSALEARTSAHLDRLRSALFTCRRPRFNKVCDSTPFDWTLPF